MHSRICHEYMMGQPVWSAVYRSGRDLPVPACMHDPDRSHSAVGDEYFIAETRHNLSEALLKKGDLEQAEHENEQVLDVATKLGFIEIEVWALYIGAFLSLERGKRAHTIELGLESLQKALDRDLFVLIEADVALLVRIHGEMQALGEIGAAQDLINRFQNVVADSPSERKSEALQLWQRTLPGDSASGGDSLPGGS